MTARDAGTLTGVIARVARGLGAAVIPSIVATPQPDLRAIRIDLPRFVRTIGLARRAGSFGPPAEDAFATGLLLLDDAGWPGMRPATAVPTGVVHVGAGRPAGRPNTCNRSVTPARGRRPRKQVYPEP